jgi:mono/diheme cytochrome c family protein
MLNRIVPGILGAGIIGLLAFLALAWRPVIPAIQPPDGASFPAELVGKGEALAGAGYCVVCHTRPGGQPFAGGYGLHTNFGTIYSSNITPDPETGIGGWSQAAFARAMHEGVSRDGSHLFPAFPYDHFTKVSDADVNALYAYMMTRPAVMAPARANTLPFPLNIRALQEGWKLLFFRSGRYRQDTANSAEWNRGAYLAEGLSHCGACHTPRNLLGAEKTGEAYAGGVVDDWIAPALTDANPSPVPWRQWALFSYLRTGEDALHGVSAGPMSPVIHTGFAAVPDADLQALAVYFSDIDHAASREAVADAAVSKALARSKLGSSREYDPDARLYAGACIGCHYNASPATLAARPELALSSALTLSEPTDLIQIVLGGIGVRDGGPGLVMPSYASALTDADIGRLAAYLRRTRTDQPPWTGLEDKIATIRKQPATSQ